LRRGIEEGNVSVLLRAKYKIVLVLVVSIVLLDQLTKLIVDRAMPLNHSIPIIDGFFNLTYIRNTGAAFGIFAGSHAAFRQPFLILFSVLAIGFILVMLRRLPEEEKGLLVALSFILGGAVGNLIDRLVYGEVIDFLDFYWSWFHWPAFNLADSFITVGVTLTLYRLIRAKGKDPFSAAERKSL
jgi:signal peptidase II